VKKLGVYYSGWGEDWLLGLLADDGTRLLFEYSPEAQAQDLQLSPLHLPLRAAAFGDFPSWQWRLPGFIADSLPDGWGLLLMDRLLRQQGRRHTGPLDRLAFIGDRAMGALRFEPATDLGAPPPEWDLLRLAKESHRVLAGEANDVLRAMALTGGSPQGARPKGLVQYDTATRKASTLGSAVGAPWLVKFPAQSEHKEVCAIEQLYAQLARDCFEMPVSEYFDLGPKLAAFGVARFDREAGHRVPVLSLAGLLHVDFRTPASCDYTALLRATQLLTRDEREVHKVYARAVFNVIFHNRDDHPKNFAWRLGQDRRWRLAPAFDLTFSEGPMGQHHIDVCGEAQAVTRVQLLRLATEGGVSTSAANDMIDKIAEQSGRFRALAAGYPIRRATVQHIAKVIEQCRALAAGT
jgi:serine/threonine-protein kinase HipA